MLLGRIAGSSLSRLITGPNLLLLAQLLTLAGFPFFWLAGPLGLRLAGLFVTGLGVANLFPLTLAVTLGTAPQQGDRASARIAVGGGAAIFGAPLALGWFADRAGIFNAFGLTLGLLLLILAVTYLANRRKDQ